MMSADTKTSMEPNKMLTMSRITTLLGSILVALSSGTNYIYSAYAPQLGARLRVSHTQLNIIGLAGNMGGNISGPIWGRIVDRKGPGIPLICACISLLVGYLGIKKMYDDGIGDGMAISPLHFALLVVCSFMTGSGGNAGLGAATNSTAKSFPSSLRATTTGLVLSGFGLSAFWFSLLASTLFPGDTSAFLLVLALGTAVPMVVGLFTVKPIPLPPTNANHSHSDATEEYELIQSGDAALFIEEPQVSSSLTSDWEDFGSSEKLKMPTSSTNGALFLGTSLSGEFSPVSSNGHPVHEDTQKTHWESDVEAEADEDAESDSASAPLLSHDQETSSYRVPVPCSVAELNPSSSCRERSVVDKDGLPDIHGMQLWSTPDFYLIFLIIGICGGTGIMYINNVGSIAQALYAKTHPVYDDVEASKWQAAQVSILSIGNFSGRILIGLISDFAHTRLRLPRVNCLCIVSCCFILSQAAAMIVSSVETLWIATLLLGLAYGSLFGSLPTIMIEWFGLAHLAENLGFVAFSPALGGNLFSLIFGVGLDNHASKQESHSSLAPRALSLIGLASRGLPSEHQCFDGKECYVGSLRVTLVACIVSLGLSWWAGIRDGQINVRARSSRGIERRL